MTNALANKQGQLAPLKNVDPKDIIERYLKEETSTEIAKDLGVTKSALSFFMLKHAEKDWQDAQIIKATAHRDNALEMIEKADNALDLARARELLRHAQWELERVLRRIYGQDAPVNAAQAVQININLRSGDATNAVQHEVIEGKPASQE